MKKITILTIIIMIIGLIFMSNVSKAAVEDIQEKIKVSDTIGKKGEKVTVKITVTKDIQLDNDGLLLGFDKNNLKYDSSAVANVQNVMIMGGNRENHPAGPDGFSIALISTIADKATIKAGTELATITFEILEKMEVNQMLTLRHYKGATKTTLSTGMIKLKTDNQTEIPSNPSNPSNPSTPDNPKQDNDQKQDKIVYDMLEGKNSIWKNGKSKNLVFRSSAAFDKFVNVIIDENVVDKEYYITKSGSTIIEIKENYLKTLKGGAHKIIINSKDGSAEADFKVEQQGENTAKLLPKTGGEINPVVFALCIILAINIGVTLFLYRKNRR